MKTHITISNNDNTPIIIDGSLSQNGVGLFGAILRDHEEDTIVASARWFKSDQECHLSCTAGGIYGPSVRYLKT